MFGYVDRANEFIRILVGMAYLPDFDGIPKSFNFINGTSITGKSSHIHINYIGNDPEVFKENLNPVAFNIGEVRYSDLTKMFEIALDSAKGNRISVLISDCIYDVGEDKDPLISLAIEMEKTQQSFRTRLSSENMGTIVLKATSNFNGNYYYATRRGSLKLNNESRPFYILFFGKTELLNEILSEKNLQKRIGDSFEIAHFFINKGEEIPFQIVPGVKQIGQFRLHPTNPHKLVRAKSMHNKFQFTIATDFSYLPFSDNYLKNTANYECLFSNFKVVEVSRIEQKMPGVQGTHLITLFTDKNPLGTLSIVLKNVVPDWIHETNSDNEDIIDSTHTFGFGLLINAISGAYIDMVSDPHLASCKIEITN